ncbi:MAG: hypothetical protein PHV45_06225 [Desulfuromonas thiophila]|nr:hypothetical protein [Desulfuromonas thiophila]
MAFARIFSCLRQAPPGLLCALVADTEGETVADWVAQGSPETARILAAHLGILLRYSQAPAVQLVAGTSQQLLVHTEAAVWFVLSLTSEYYLAACWRPQGVCAHQCRLLRQCGLALRQEILFG